jgi:23S rRNA pseudouridine2605 synthase
LQKILAQAGYGSRRVCEQLILQGRVRINGQVVTQLGVQADPQCDVIEVDGKRVQLSEEHTYILLHKPAGVVTTRRDAHAARTVMDLLQSVSRCCLSGRSSGRRYHRSTAAHR